MATDDVDERIQVAANLDWFDPKFRERTEYEVYEQLRGLPPQRSKTGEWYFLSYEDCREAFQRADILSNDWVIGDSRLGQSSVYPENSDGPAHREYRRLLDPLFNPARMEALEGDMSAYARRLLEPIAAMRSTEFVSAFTMPFPTIIFCRAMGFPLEDHARLMRWKDIYMNSMTPFIARQLGITDVDAGGRPSAQAATEMTSQTAQEIIQYLGDILAERERQPQDDIVSALITLRHENGEPLDYDERIRICFNLFLGGLDTVTGMLSFIVQHFAGHPLDRQGFIELMDDPDRVGPAIEELVRFHSILAIPRRSITACPFRGTDLQANDFIQVVTPAANRDAVRFPDADRLDYSRSSNPHLGFGLGLHRCLGIHLARRELRIGLQELHRVMPEYSLDPDNAPVIGSGGVRGLFTLPLLVGARRKA